MDGVWEPTRRRSSTRRGEVGNERRPGRAGRGGGARGGGGPTGGGGGRGPWPRALAGSGFCTGGIRCPLRVPGDGARRAPQEARAGTVAGSRTAGIGRWGIRRQVGDGMGRGEWVAGRSEAGSRRLLEALA